MTILKQLTVGPLGTNCYIFGDSDTNEVAVVDPGGDGERIISIINENNYKVKFIILTHGHFDHIGAVKYIKDKTGAQILIHEYDKDMLVEPHQNLSAFFTTPDQYIVQCKEDRSLTDNDTISLGNNEIKVIHTPGHTRGGICLLYGNDLFSGDTLFMETVGRTDLPGASHSDILRSVEKLMLLDDNINVYPGHGINTNIGHERKYNPFIE